MFYLCNGGQSGTFSSEAGGTYRHDKYTIDPSQSGNKLAYQLSKNSTDNSTVTWPSKEIDRAKVTVNYSRSDVPYILSSLGWSITAGAMAGGNSSGTQHKAEIVIDAYGADDRKLASLSTQSAQGTDSGSVSKSGRISLFECGASSFPVDTTYLRVYFKVTPIRRGQDSQGWAAVATSTMSVSPRYLKVEPND